jgi:hypothetical protein
MVAGHEHYPLAGRGLPDRVQAGPGQLEHVGCRALAQLQEVSEQHHAVGLGQCGRQALEHLGAARDIGSGGRAEVQVGEDRGEHL